MGDRGSFVTQYIYCKACFEAAKQVLLSREKFLCSTTLPHWQECEKELPIIAGEVGGLYSGEELDTFEFAHNVELAELLCHPLRIAVLAEYGEKIFVVEPVRLSAKEKP